MPEQKTTELLESASTYAEKFKIFQLFESLLQELVVAKPDKPLDHLIKVLKRDPVPRVIVSGPPGAEARALCEMLAAKSKPNLVHVIASDVWRELSRLNSAAGLQAKALIDDGKEVPDELTLAMLQEKLSMGECVTQGWILEGFPLNASASRKLLAAGLLPTRFLTIAVPDAECVRRLSGRRVDPKENTIYHLEDAPPPDAEVAGRLIQRKEDAAEAVASRLLAYRQGMAGVLPCFKTVTVELDGATPGEPGLAKLVDAALPTITADMPTRAPRGAARVMLLGGPGSNAEQLGAALAQTYGAKHISAIELLHGAALNGAKKASAAMAAPEPLVAGDALLGPLIVQRLKMEDVRTAGFVLTGFPRTTQHAAYLAKNQVWLRNVVLLDLEPAAAKAIASGTRYDPVDGEIYHLETSPPTDAATKARLVAHPKDQPAALAQAMKTWNASLAGIKKVYAAELSVEDAKRPERELVERLAPCFVSL